MHLLKNSSSLALVSLMLTAVMIGTSMANPTTMASVVDAFAQGIPAEPPILEDGFENASDNNGDGVMNEDENQQPGSVDDEMQGSTEYTGTNYTTVASTSTSPTIITSTTTSTSTTEAPIVVKNNAISFGDQESSVTNNEATRQSASTDLPSTSTVKPTTMVSEVSSITPITTTVSPVDKQESSTVLDSSNVSIVYKADPDPVTTTTTTAAAPDTTTTTLAPNSSAAVSISVFTGVVLAVLALLCNYV